MDNGVRSTNDWPRLTPPTAGPDDRFEVHVTRKRHQDVGIEWCEFAHPAVKDLLRAPALRMVAE